MGQSASVREFRGEMAEMLRAIATHTRSSGIPTAELSRNRSASSTGKTRPSVERWKSFWSRRRQAITAALNWIKSIVSEPEVGVIYQGTVVKLPFWKGDTRQAALPGMARVQLPADVSPTVETSS